MQWSIVLNRRNADEYFIPKQRFEPKCSSKVQAKCQFDSHLSSFFRRRELFKSVILRDEYLTDIVFFAIDKHNKENNCEK